MPDRTRWASIVAAAVFIGAPAPAAAQGVPATDIYLAPLSMRGGRPVVGAAANVTHRAGYDNQPSFTPDGRAMLFTSIHDDGQADIYRYDLGSKATTRVTATAESEYSPTMMPGGHRFSVIRVEKDSAQRLWSFALDGSDPRIVIESLEPVGYHAWLDANTLVMFVLGSPNALVAGDLRTGRMDTLARRIGRSLARIPDGSGFSFTQTVDSARMLRTMRAPGRPQRDLVALPRGSEDIVWLDGRTVLAGSGSSILVWRRGSAAWAEVADLSGPGLTQISRLAVSPDGRWLAIVAVPRR